MAAEPETVFATIPRGATEDLRVSLSTYRGSAFVDVRVFTTFAATGVYGPTKKGVTIAPARIGEVIAALEEAQADCRRRGLIG